MGAICENIFLFGLGAAARYYITAILKAVARIVDAALIAQSEQASARPVSSSMPVNRTSYIIIDFERTLSGTRAKGKIDYSLVFQRSVVVPVLDATRLNVLHLESAIYPLAVQLETLRRQEYRAHVAKYPHIPSADISKYLDAYPRYGVVTTADYWVFIRYRKVGDKWKLERTESILLDLAERDLTIAQAAALRETLDKVVNVLSGRTLDSVRNVQKVETLLAKHSIT